MNIKLPIYLFLFLLLSCSSDHDEDVKQTIITGVAYDAITHQPFDSLLIEIRNERCFFSDFGTCEDVNKTAYTGKDGKYYFTMLQNCDSEVYIRFSNKDARNYKNVSYSFVENNAKNISFSCNDNILLPPGTRHNINIVVEPKINLILKHTDNKSIKLKNIKIPAWNLEVPSIEYLYQTIPLKLFQYEGSLEIILEYDGISDKTIQVDYNYFESQEIEVNIQS